MMRVRFPAADPTTRCRRALANEAARLSALQATATLGVFDPRQIVSPDSVLSTTGPWSRSVDHTMSLLSRCRPYMPPSILPNPAHQSVPTLRSTTTLAVTYKSKCRSARARSSLLSSAMFRSPKDPGPALRCNYLPSASLASAAYGTLFERRQIVWFVTIFAVDHFA